MLFTAGGLFLYETSCNIYIKRMTVKYIGRIYNTCENCDKYTIHKYMITPHKAIVNLLSEKDQKPRYYCENCAKRESGPRSKEWQEVRRKE